MNESGNKIKSFLNNTLIKANTDWKTGEVRKPFSDQPIKEFYQQSGVSEKMGNKEIGFGKELLENNRERAFNRIKEIATENGTWTKENIKKAEAIKLVLYNLPITHFTTESRLKGNGEESFWLSNLETNGLLSGDQIVQKGGSAYNTFEEDIQIDRHKYVYACLGELYMAGGAPNDMCAVIINKSLLKDPSCLVQDYKFMDQLIKTKVEHSSLNMKEGFQKTNESTLIGQDYISMLALGMATNVVDYNSTFPEVMIKDKVSVDKIDCILEPSTETNTDVANENFVKDMEAASKNNDKNISSLHYKRVNAPINVFYNLQGKSALAPDTSFKSKPQPWYKKVLS
jgi:hypothetical protein